MTRLARLRARLAATLARRRVPLGFAFGALVWWLAAPTPASLLVGASIAVVGEAIRIWAAGHLNKSREITASGPYRWIAHPLYVGSSVMGGGLAIASASAAAAALIAVYLGATITAAVRNEEAFLRRTFGDRYDRYRRGEIVSGAGDVASDSAIGLDERRRFSLERAMRNREHRAMIGLAIAVGLLMLKARPL
jgi:hypothetical protein